MTKIVKTKKLLSSAAIVLQAKDIAKRSKSIAKEIHKLAMVCLHHVDQHGDTTPALKLVATLKESGVDCNGLVAWFSAEGRMKLKLIEPAENAKSQAKVSVFKRDSVREPIDFDHANKNPFFKAREAEKKADKPATPTSKVLQSTVSKLEKLAEECDVPNLNLASAIRSLKAAATAAATYESAAKDAAIAH